MARGGYRPVWACSRAGRISFRRWRRAPHSCHEGTCPVPGRTPVACGRLPAVAMRMAYEFWNQASLEEMGQVLNTPYGARCFLAQAVRPIRRVYQAVLMHRMALSAF